MVSVKCGNADLPPMMDAVEAREIEVISPGGRRTLWKGAASNRVLKVMEETGLKLCDKARSIR